MGAILAIIGERGDPELPLRLERMTARSPYRGRAERILVDGVALGVQSLGWDASLGERGPYVVAFHGWVGNWDDVARSSGLDLSAAADDAARLAVAFEAMGTRVFARLRGEFAVAILDRCTGSLTVARDVIGVRPLFVHRHAGRTFIASEIRQALAGSAAPPRLDEVFLATTLVRTYGTGEDTFYAGVRQVVSGHAYVFDVARADAEPRRAAYWSPPGEEPARGKGTGAFAEELRLVLDRAVARSLAQRPGAVALSGGMDSSTIWALARRRARTGERQAELVGAFSLVFPGFDCDESGLVGDILSVTGGDAVSVDATAIAPFEAIEGLIEGVDGPFVSTLYLGSFIARAARTAGREVLYYGLGGDDWLTGTPYYLGDELRRGHLIRVLSDARTLVTGPILGRPLRLARFTVGPVAGLPWRRMRAIPPWLHRSRRGALLRPPAVVAGSRAGYALARMLTVHRAVSYLGNAEFVTAREGVELRCPLHDLDVVEFAFRAPGRVVMGGWREKHLLRLATADVLPGSVVERAGKTEFSGPMRRDVASFARREDVRSWRLVARDIVTADAIERMRRELAEGGGAAGFYDFMRLAIAERFCRRFDPSRSGVVQHT